MYGITHFWREDVKICKTYIGRELTFKPFLSLGNICMCVTHNISYLLMERIMNIILLNTTLQKENEAQRD